MIPGRTLSLDDHCPHGKPLRDCGDAWCRGRAEGLARGETALPGHDDTPEAVDEVPAADSYRPGQCAACHKNHQGGSTVGQPRSLSCACLCHETGKPYLPNASGGSLDLGGLDEIGELSVTSAESPSGPCSGCDARWTGERICHCSVCHLTFTSIGPFDFHQKWNYRTEPARLHCMTPDELREAGYEPNGNGHWRKPTDNRWFDNKDGDD